MTNPTKGALIERIRQLAPKSKALTRKKHADLARLLAMLERKSKPTKRGKPTEPAPVTRAPTPAVELIPLASFAPPMAILAPPIEVTLPAKVDTQTPLVAGIVAVVMARVVLMVAPALRHLA